MKSSHIYLVFTQTGTWLSKLIYLATGMKYAHTSLCLNHHFTQMYSFGRVNPDNPFSGGFVVENIHGGVFKKFAHCACLIYRVEVTEEQRTQLMRELSVFMQNQKNLKYNFLGLFGVMFNVALKRRHSYFCSQFVTEVLMRSNIVSGNHLPELARPSDLLAIENKEFVYEGPAQNVQTPGYFPHLRFAHSA